MLALDEGTVRASFVNATRKELSDLTPPAYLGFDVEAGRLERIRTLRDRAAGFAEAVVA